MQFSPRSCWCSCWLTVRARCRDWHSRDSHSEHFKRFSEHCIANTPGAALVLGLEEGAKDRPNEFFVNASKVRLSSFMPTFSTGQLTCACCHVCAGGVCVCGGACRRWFGGASKDTGLNDFEETDLPQLLHRAQQNAAAKGAKLRVGVVGVWTEIKVPRVTP